MNNCKVPQTQLVITNRNLVKGGRVKCLSNSVSTSHNAFFLPTLHFWMQPLEDIYTDV